MIKSSPKLNQSSCLVNINDELSNIINDYKPEVCAVESVIYVQSYKTAITLELREGCNDSRCFQRHTNFRICSKRVKQAVVGKGEAKKDQVAFMIRALLSLKETPQSDAADALAVGLAHLYTNRNALQDEAISGKI